MSMRNGSVSGYKAYAAGKSRYEVGSTVRRNKTPGDTFKNKRF